MRRLIEPFGSLKKLVILLGIFLLSRLVDIMLTYLGMEAGGWILIKERVLISQLLMRLLGFFPSAIVGTILATILLLVCARLMFSFAIMAKIDAARARRATTAFTLWCSALGLLYGSSWIHRANIDIPPAIKYFLGDFFLFTETKVVIRAVDVLLAISIVSTVLVVGAAILWPWRSKQQK